MRAEERQAALLKLLKLAVEKDQAILRAVQDEAEVLRKKLSELADQLSISASADLESAHRHDKHRDWINKERKRLSTELASVMARKGEAEAELRVSFGKKHAFEAVIDAKGAAVKYPDA